jgi:PAS domain S-box-containing protein
MSTPTRMRGRPSRFTVLVGATAFTFALLVVCFAMYVRAEKAIDTANDRRHRSFLLAEELRQSSDDLTRMVRTYVATGAPIWRRHYEEILGIRDGRLPRPLEYDAVYWDLVGPDDRRPRPAGPAVPLIDLMARAGITEDELALLAQGKAESDALTRTEFAAMALVESGTVSLPADRARALAMLHDDAYRAAKAAIMRPILEFELRIDARTLRAVHAAEADALRMRVAFVMLGLLLAFLLWSVRQQLTSLLGGSLDDVIACLGRLSRGEFGTEVPVLPGHDGSVLGRLRRTQDDLARLDAQRREAEARIRESERRFHQVLDDMLEGCMIIDFDWRYLYVNDAAARHGHLVREEIVGRRMTDLHPGIQATVVFGHFDHVMKRREPRRFEESVTFADGSTAWYEFSAAPTAEGLFVLSLDITERRLLAERLARTNADLERQVAQRTADLQAALDAAHQASEAKSAFLSNMSHELRTPMNAILGFAQLLQMQPLPAEQARQVDEVRRAGEHLLALIDDLLDLTRIESGQLAITLAPVDVAGLVEDALGIVRPLITQRGLALENRVPAGLRGMADAVRLRQVVVNLLSNAAKYNREGGRVVVEAGPAPSGPARVRLSVTDAGAGLAPELLPRLFRTFERLDAARRGVEGTGIGLALSRHLVERMGGTIGVDSRPGVGSTFWVELPAAAPT